MWWLLYFLESEKSLHLQTHLYSPQGGMIPLAHLCFVPWAPQERIPFILIQLKKWGNKTSSYFSVSLGHHMQAPAKFRASLCHRAPETWSWKLDGWGAQAGRSESIGEIGKVYPQKSGAWRKHWAWDNENERGQRQARMKKYWVVCSLCTKARGRVLTQAQGSPDSPPPLGRGKRFSVRQSQGSILTPPLLKLCDALENRVLCAVLSSINGKLI